MFEVRSEGVSRAVFDTRTLRLPGTCSPPSNRMAGTKTDTLPRLRPPGPARTSAPLAAAKSTIVMSTLFIEYGPLILAQQVCYYQLYRFVSTGGDCELPTV